MVKPETPRSRTSRQYESLASCPNARHAQPHGAVLYAAADFATAFAEVVVRDRLVQRDRRLVPFGDIVARGWVEFTSNQVPLQMVGLRESGCLILGAPTDTAHARNQAVGRALGLASLMMTGLTVTERDSSPRVGDCSRRAREAGGREHFLSDSGRVFARVSR
jgi:RES domain